VRRHSRNLAWSHRGTDYRGQAWPRAIWTIATFTALAALVLIIALASGLAYRAYRRHAAANATTIDPVHGIDEAVSAYGW
jgi:hypothetical protein